MLGKKVGLFLSMTKLLQPRLKMSTQKLSGKVAVITASTEGIGFEIARKLGENGATVVVSSRKENNVQKALKALKENGITSSGLVCHVGKKQDRENLIQHTLTKHGKIDILVSNAGTNPQFGDILDCTEEQWDKLFDTNVKSAFFLTTAVVPHMEKIGGGSIVYISSIAGYQLPPFIAPYGVSKTALIGMTKAFGMSLASRNIRVNGVAPGFIDTKFSEAISSSAAIKDKLVESIAMERFGRPEDCSGIVSFLCSDDAAYITGETIVVAGEPEESVIKTVVLSTPLCFIWWAQHSERV